MFMCMALEGTVNGNAKMLDRFACACHCMKVPLANPKWHNAGEPYIQVITCYSAAIVFTCGAFQLFVESFEASLSELLRAMAPVGVVNHGAYNCQRLSCALCLPADPVHVCSCCLCR